MPLLPYDAPPATYAFIGDSQASVFDGMILHDEGSAVPSVLARAQWLPHFRAQDFYSESGFSDLMTRMLWSLHILRPTTAGGFEAFPRTHHTVFGETMNDVSFEVRRPEKVLVVCIGVYEMLRTANERASAARVDANVEEEFTPVLLGLRALRQAGCRNLFVNPLAPPRRPLESAYTDEDVERVARAINATLREWCLREQIGYLDTWELLMSGGHRDETLFSDEIHLNRQGATAVLNEINRALAERFEKALTHNPTNFPA